MNAVGVKINDSGKILYFDPNGLNLKLNLTVIVETDKGLQFAKIVEFLEINENFPHDKVIRIATKKDYIQHLKNFEAGEKALVECRKLVLKNNLNMSILDATYNFDRSQLIFRFLSDERVDFRQLAKILGAKLRTRIELRQIGVRDKAKEVGGVGPCGRFLCCSTFLTSFDTVSISMAKNQGLALNPTKINGVCGRLLCCLNYENDEYVKAKVGIPEVGKKITFKNKEGKVISSDPLAGKYKILVDNEIIVVDKDDSEK